MTRFEKLYLLYLAFLERGLVGTGLNHMTVGLEDLTSGLKYVPFLYNACRIADTMRNGILKSMPPANSTLSWLSDAANKWTVAEIQAQHKYNFDQSTTEYPRIHQIDRHIPDDLFELMYSSTWDILELPIITQAYGLVSTIVLISNNPSVWEIRIGMNYYNNLSGTCTIYEYYTSPHTLTAIETLTFDHPTVTVWGTIHTYTDIYPQFVAVNQLTYSQTRPMY